MNLLDRRLELLKEKKSFSVKEIITDLFNILFDNLWDMNTPLREYVAFRKNSDIEKNQIMFIKPEYFVNEPLKNTNIHINFSGLLKTNTTGKVVADYVRGIVEGYYHNENVILEILKMRTAAISKSASTFGIKINPDKVPILNGLYHSHNLKLTNAGDSISLNCKSLMSVYL